MTFCCKNYIEAKGRCGMLDGECVPGRKGCVLEGQFKLSTALAEKISEADDKAKSVPDQP